VDVGRGFTGSNLAARIGLRRSAKR
jgi:hypothetical protein